MTGEALINVCQAVTHGSERYVKNRRSGREGRVIACSQDELVVQVGAGRESWSIEDCEEVEKESLRFSA